MKSDNTVTITKIIESAPDWPLAGDMGLGDQLDQRRVALVNLLLVGR
ncbi:hypothetical protein HRJ34_25750 [Rhizorhabdus wittichii]|uniref:Uncharacterized protein n=1 Tax=Rhizorhabdus wittichii TaxID=160791 RepID=A0A975D2C7_9SPHN|nr:hypothetical protein [Rhizorhabdus wittichii]QTH21667.1 hypothetical protein HRJ34_25750 [Rhizorhabdus wittichii]